MLSKQLLLLQPKSQEAGELATEGTPCPHLAPQASTFHLHRCTWPDDALLNSGRGGVGSSTQAWGRARCDGMVACGQTATRSSTPVSSKCSVRQIPLPLTQREARLSLRPGWGSAGQRKDKRRAEMTEEEKGRVWGPTPVVSALGRPKREDHCEFKASQA